MENSPASTASDTMRLSPGDTRLILDALQLRFEQGHYRPVEDLRQRLADAVAAGKALVLRQRKGVARAT